MSENSGVTRVGAEKQIILEVRGVTKVFGPVVALNNVDLILHKGDVLGLIGENGSGKSTITSIVAGMQKATKAESIKLKVRSGNLRPCSTHWTTAERAAAVSV